MSGSQYAVLLYLGAAVLLFLLHQLISLWKAYRSPLRSIPGPWYAPFTTLHLMYGFATGRIWKSAANAHEKYGPIVRLGPRQLWVSDKHAVKQILSGIDLPKVSMYAEISRDRHSPGLFGEIRQEPHKRLKRFLSPAFTVSYVDQLDHYFGSAVRALVQKYESRHDNSTGNRVFQTDLMVDLHNVALDIMGDCSFGRGFGRTNPTLEKTDNQLIWATIPEAIFVGMTKRYKEVYVKRLLRRLGVEWTYDWPAPMIMAIDSLVTQRQLDAGSTRGDLLQHMVEQGTKPDSGYPMTTRDIVDQMAEILLAGSETTSGTIACFFLEICRNPEVRARLLESLPPLAPDASMIDSKQIRSDSRYDYLNACIKEVLRLHPIASEMGRRTGTEAVQLMGHLLPPHTVVSASYRNLHRNPEFWPEPLRFWPERWLKNSGAPPPDMDAYYPFSAGKHSCIGINFAWAEMRMVAANLWSRYSFEEMPGQHVDYRQYITMQFETGKWRVQGTRRI